MGTKTSKSVDKGPFSDEEYSRLSNTHKSHRLNEDGLMGIFSLKIVSVDKVLSRGIYKYFKKSDKIADGLSIEEWVHGVASCSRVSSKSILRTLFSIFQDDKDMRISRERLSVLIIACLAMSRDENSPIISDKFVNLLVKSIFESVQKPIENLDFDSIVTYSGSSMPLLHTTFKQWISVRCFDNIRSYAFYKQPTLSTQSCILKRDHLVALSWMRAALQTDLNQLYTSTKDGLSFNRLCFHILGYDGPTLIVCLTNNGETFGIYADQVWKDSNVFFGGNECFIFTLFPTYSVLNSKPNGQKNYLYLNTKGISSPKGLGIGGRLHGFRIFFDEDFENCSSRSSCLSYDRGEVTSNNNFQLDVIEVKFNRYCILLIDSFWN